MSFTKETWGLFPGSTIRDYSIINGNFTNNDALYGPWKDFDEFVETITMGDFPSLEALKNEKINILTPGLTVGIIDPDTNKVVEFWNPDGSTSFVKKNYGCIGEIYAGWMLDGLGKKPHSNNKPTTLLASNPPSLPQQFVPPTFGEAHGGGVNHWVFLQ